MKAMTATKATEHRLLALAVLVLATSMVACRDQASSGEATQEEDHHILKTLKA